MFKIIREFSLYMKSHIYPDKEFKRFISSLINKDIYIPVYKFT